MPPDWGRGLEPCREILDGYLRCEGWVYLVGPLAYEHTGCLANEQDLKLVRLGFTTDLIARIRTHAEYIRPGTNPLIAAIPGSRSDEQFFHKLLSRSRCEGSMYWGNECYRAAASAAIASYDGEIGQYLYGSHRVFPEDWVEEQMLWAAIQFKKDADKSDPREFDPSQPFRTTMDILLRQIAMYAYVHLPSSTTPHSWYQRACSDRRLFRARREHQRNPIVWCRKCQSFDSCTCVAPEKN